MKKIFCAKNVWATVSMVIGLYLMYQNLGYAVVTVFPGADWAKGLLSLPGTQSLTGVRLFGVSLLALLFLVYSLITILVARLADSKRKTITLNLINVAAMFVEPYLIYQIFFGLPGTFGFLVALLIGGAYMVFLYLVLCHNIIMAIKVIRK